MRWIYEVGTKGISLMCASGSAGGLSELEA